jgi:hypothetical protein
MQRSILSIACVAAALIVLPSATAGGWWTSIRIDRTRVAIGQEMKVHANVMFRSVDAAEAAQTGETQGGFYVYLLRGFDYSIVQRAMREASPRNWWSVGGADAFRAGRVVIGDRESNLALAKASFRVPKLPPGRYTVMFCDAGCAHPLADVIPTLPKQLTVTAPQTADGSPWVQKAGWLVVGVVLGALLGFVLGRLGGQASSPEWVAARRSPSRDRLDGHGPRGRVDRRPRGPERVAPSRPRALPASAEGGYQGRPKV